MPGIEFSHIFGKHQPSKQPIQRALRFPVRGCREVNFDGLIRHVPVLVIGLGNGIGILCDTGGIHIDREVKISDAVHALVCRPKRDGSEGLSLVEIDLIGIRLSVYILLSQAKHTGMVPIACRVSHIDVVICAAPAASLRHAELKRDMVAIGHGLVKIEGVCSARIAAPADGFHSAEASAEPGKGCRGVCGIGKRCGRHAQNQGKNQKDCNEFFRCNNLLQL